MRRLLDGQPEPQFGLARDGDIGHSQGDPSFVLETLGFQGAVPLATRLR